MPGLVDMHAHPAPGHWKYGIDPDVHILPRGTTTVLAQGDAGAATWPYYREHIIERSRTRVRLAISPAAQGEAGPTPCFDDLGRLDVDACVAAIEDGADLVWGIAVNLARPTCGRSDPREVMSRTLAIAERTGRPLLFGKRMEPSDWPLSDQLSMLRAGDVVTYCFHGGAESILEGGRVLASVWEARERGVLFDVGHGMASFDFAVAESAIAQGFLPDTISSDQYRRHVGSVPRHDLPRTISKLIAAGMSQADALAGATARPARALGLAGEVGTLAVGSCADLALLRWNPDAAPLADVAGAERPGACLETVLTVRAGEVILPEDAPG